MIVAMDRMEIFMNSQHFCLKTDIYFKQGAIKEIANLNIEKACIVTDKFMVQVGLVKKLEDILKEKGIKYKIFDEVQSDPSLDIVKRGIFHLVEGKPNAILALGGGSVIDTAKAIVFFDVKLQEKILRKGDTKKVSLVAIPTTSGTGSEVTSYSVITDKENNVKIPLKDNLMLPDIAILDSDMTATLPKKVIADSGMDVLTHAIEAYVSPIGTEFTKAYARRAISLVFENLLAMYNDVSIEEHRNKMLLASCMAGIAFEEASLGLNHGMAHTIGALFSLPHGFCNAVLMPYVIGYNSGLMQYKSLDNEVARKYFEIADMLKLKSNYTKEAIESLIKEICTLNFKLGIVSNFEKSGIDKDRFIELIPQMIEQTLSDACTKQNPVIPDRKSLEQLYRGII